MVCSRHLLGSQIVWETTAGHQPQGIPQGIPQGLPSTAPCLRMPVIFCQRNHLSQRAVHRTMTFPSWPLVVYGNLFPAVFQGPGHRRPPGHGHCPGQGFPEGQAPRCPHLPSPGAPPSQWRPALPGCSPPASFCFYLLSLVWHRFSLVTRQDDRHNHHHRHHRHNRHHRHHLQNPVRPRPRDPSNLAKDHHQWRS